MREGRYEYTTGFVEYYHNCKLHRDDGPAIEYPTGSKCWYQFGKLHRVDGPAIERSDGSIEYWINGVRYAETEFRFWSKIFKT